ncbi:neuronal acetylcholine receptor subunit alpha-5-like [Hyalella azteca]|uniref:Neuronal acetylcholine receptor subunit alpha-5-like n=1 Tax=Hyalella azteca TaxID=294128 RepID=A0A8B7NS67_HYAAZ|nr:neuronal acetylcholine receptor subunit alpha-5-like [Hyalella azteca]
MMRWVDPRLSRSALSATFVPKLTFAPTRVWHPDIVLTNGLDAASTGTVPPVLLTALPSGQMTHVYPATVRVACFAAAVAEWPHDALNCAANFGSWVHDADAIEILADEYVSIDMIRDRVGEDESESHVSWTVIDSSVRKQAYVGNGNDSSSYPSVTLTLNLVRQPGWNIRLLQFVLVALSLVTGVVFVLPPGALEKALLGGLCLLLQLHFLAYTAAFIPHSPSHTPILVALTCGQVVVTMVMMVLSVVMVRLAHSPPTPALAPVPGIRRPLRRNYAGRRCGIPCCKTASEDYERDAEASYSLDAVGAVRRSSEGALPHDRRRDDEVKTSSPTLVARLQCCLFVIYYMFVSAVMITYRSVLFS